MITTPNFFDNSIKNFIRAYKLFIVIVSSFLLISFVYAFLIISPIFQSKSLLEIREQQQGSSSPMGMNSQSSGFASLIGVTLGQGLGGGGSVDSYNELKSRLNSIEFVQSFLKESEDAQNLVISSGVLDNQDFQDYMSASTPYSLFKNFQSKCKISKDIKTNMVLLVCDDTNPEVAKNLLTGIIEFINNFYKNKDSLETAENIEFLQAALLKQQSTYVRARLISILESELQKNMLAFTAADYKLKIIDPPDSFYPKYKPQRSIILALGLILGVIFSMLSTILLVQNNKVLPIALQSVAQRLLGIDDDTA